MWPCCWRPSMLPAPRSSRSSAAMRKPAPSSLNSFMAERVQLGQPEAIGAVDEDGVGTGDIEAVLDDGRGDENVGFIANELEHDGLELFFAHLAMTDNHTSLGNELRDESGQ